MSRAPVFVSFHTPDERYRTYATRLRASLERHALDWAMMELGPMPTWVETCALKPGYVLNALTNHDRPVVWLDADAEVVERPDLLLRCVADFAVSTFDGPRTRNCCGVAHTLPEDFPDGRWFNSGTVFINDTPKGRELARRWREVQADHPRWWDQWTLQQAWCDVHPETEWLPETYCAWRRRPGAVIAQSLASTEWEAVRV